MEAPLPKKLSRVGKNRRTGNNRRQQ